VSREKLEERCFGIVLYFMPTNDYLGTNKEGTDILFHQRVAEKLTEC
jgi:hypothetical protein